MRPKGVEVYGEGVFSPGTPAMLLNPRMAAQTCGTCGIWPGDPRDPAPSPSPPTTPAEMLVGSTLRAEITRMPTSAWHAPPIMDGTNALWPGARHQQSGALWAPLAAIGEGFFTKRIGGLEQ